MESCSPITKINISPLQHCLWLVTYYARLLLIKSHDPLIMWSRKIMWQTKNIIFPLTKRVAIITKLGRLVTYPKELLPLELIITKTTVTSHKMMGSHIYNHKSLWSYGLARSHDKLNPLYFSTTIMPIDTKLNKTTTYCGRLPPLKQHDPLIMWPTRGHMAIWKIYISTFTIIMPTNLCRVLTSERNFSMETLKCHQFLVIIITIFISKYLALKISQLWQACWPGGTYWSCIQRIYWSNKNNMNMMSRNISIRLIFAYPGFSLGLSCCQAQPYSQELPCYYYYCCYYCFLFLKRRLFRPVQQNK